MVNLTKALIGVHLLRWIATHPVDKVIRSLNNWRLTINKKTYSGWPWKKLVLKCRCLLYVILAAVSSIHWEDCIKEMCRTHDSDLITALMSRQQHIKMTGMIKTTRNSKCSTTHPKASTSFAFSRPSSLGFNLSRVCVIRATGCTKQEW